MARRMKFRPGRSALMVSAAKGTASVTATRVDTPDVKRLLTRAVRTWLLWITQAMCSRVKRPSVISDRWASLIRGNKFVKKSTTAIPTSQEPLSRTWGRWPKLVRTSADCSPLDVLTAVTCTQASPLTYWWHPAHQAPSGPKTRGSPAPVTITSRFASFSKQLVKTLLVGLSLFYEHLGLDRKNLDLRKRGESGGRIDVVSKRHVPHVGGELLPLAREEEVDESPGRLRVLGRLHDAHRLGDDRHSLFRIDDVDGRTLLF